MKCIVALAIILKAIQRYIGVRIVIIVETPKINHMAVMFPLWLSQK
jgi:hypothetical protein